LEIHDPHVVEYFLCGEDVVPRKGLYRPPPGKGREPAVRRNGHRPRIDLLRFEFIVDAIRTLRGACDGRDG
jgi:hypothetical protein